MRRSQATFTRGGASPGGAGARLGFTLLEVLIVVTIISLLIGLLTAAVMGAFSTGRLAVVRAEISNLESAVAAFRAKFGIDPPSTIYLYESGTGSPSWATPVPADGGRSRALIRKLWPQFNFALPRDFNGDGDSTDALLLNGAECLVFFLGGVRAPTGVGVIGFSKNPANPFAGQSPGEVRDAPFFEFSPSRLASSPRNPGMYVYLDPLPGDPVPYLYVSSNDGRGYPAPASGSPTVPPVDMRMGPDGSPLNAAPTSLLNVYRGQDASATSPGQPYKAQSFQIICAGYDRFFGYGGQWAPENPELLTRDATLGTYPDADNLTNFHRERLRP